MIWFGNIPGIYAQGIMMEHLACPWLSLKKVTDAHKTGHCFIPAFDFAAKLAIFRSDFSELAIGKLEKKLMQKSGSKFAAICREDWREFARDREEIEKAPTDFVPGFCAWLAESLASAYWRLDQQRQIVGGRRARPSRPGRPRRPSRPAPPPTTKGSRRNRHVLGGNVEPKKMRRGQNRSLSRPRQLQTSRSPVRICHWRFIEVFF